MYTERFPNIIVKSTISHSISLGLSEISINIYKVELYKYL